MKRREWTVVGFVSLSLAGSGFVQGVEPRPATATNTAAKAKLSNDQIGVLLEQAMSLARIGAYDEAEARCQRVLDQNPGHPGAKQVLAAIQAQRDQIDSQLPGAALTQTLAEIIVPELVVRDADPSDVIERLRAESKRLRREINFVWQVPADQKLPKITLNLRKVPMLDVIQYVTTLARVSYRVERRAVVIYIPGSQPTAPASPPSAGSNVKPQ